MTDMHSLLKRQLERHFGDRCQFGEKLRAFLRAVDDAYKEFDVDRGMLERSLELSSQELMEANSEMRAVFQTIPDLLFRLDKKGVILEFAAAKFSDFFKDPRDLIGKRIQDVPDRDVADQFLAAIEKVRETKSLVMFEYGFQLEQEEQYFEARLMPLLQDQMIAIVRNITEKRKTEENLRESERRLDCIMQGSPIAALVISRDHRVIYWNRAMEELTGVSATEMVGSDRHWSAFYPTWRPLLADLLVDRDFVGLMSNYPECNRSVLLDEAMEGSRFFPGLGGRDRTIQFTAAAIRDSRGELVGAIETYDDITEGKKAQEALAEAEEKYRSIFENAVEGIFQLSMAGSLISLNAAFVQTLGYNDAQEVLDQITDFGAQVFVNPKHYLELLDLIEKSGVVKEFETQFRRRDATIAWITLNVRAIRDEAGRISWLEGTAQDITERKALEARLIEKQKMDAIGALAGGIAHDFNNILTPIIGYTELALNDLSQTARLETNLKRVLKSAHRAKDLVSQILHFSRRSEQQYRPVHLGLLVKEAMELIRALLPSTIEIRQNMEPRTMAGTVMADPTQMHQILMNLCANAGHAMRLSGGVLEVSLGDEEISTASMVEKEQPGGMYLKLSVRDTGEGMEPEVTQRIFDPYFTTKRVGEGTGLGLAVVYSIVKNHKGAIKVFSEPGKGSVFSVYLPRLDREAVESTAVKSSVIGGSGRIMVVDDEEDIVELEKQMLEELGYEVMPTRCGTEALHAFRASPERFDLVLTDQTMPGMTGVELAKEILSIRAGIPIVLCTGLGDSVHMKACKDGIGVILAKPISFRQMAETVKNLLSDSAMA